MCLEQLKATLEDIWSSRFSEKGLGSIKQTLTEVSAFDGAVVEGDA